MRKLTIWAIIIIFISAYLWWGNNDIVTTTIEYANVKIPSELNGYVIVHISDLHNKQFKNLTEKVLLHNPDMIVITGDLIDRNSRDITPTLEFLERAMEIAPVYYVSGNHEATSDKYAFLQEQLIELGVVNLIGGKIELGDGANILGVEDRLINPDVDGVLNELSNTDDFQILLSHRPELLDIYAKHGIDLAFTGHAHGGGIRLPFIGGLVAPNQGIFPKYTSGEYTQGETTMILSRGLGNSSSFPLRIFNRPEIVVVNLVVK